MDETRVTSPTGGSKGRKLARFDLIPTMPLRKLAEHFGRGATKYEDRNWERGYDWSLSYAAAQRHLNAFWGGEDWDPEFPESHHLDAAMFHIMALRDFVENQPGYDDRPSSAATKTKLTKEFNEAFGTKTTSSETTSGLTPGQQAKRLRRVGEVQTYRWEVP